MGFLTSTFAITESEFRGEGAWLRDFGDVGSSTSSGVRISETNVVTLSAVFASARAIAEDVSCLPLKAYRHIPEGGKEPAINDPKLAAPDGRMVNLYSLVHDQPSAELDDLKHRSLLIWWALIYGNGYAEIVRSGGQAVDMPPIHPHRVTPKRDDNGNLFYRVKNKPGEKDTDIEARNMIHLSGISDDGLMGYVIPLVGKDSFGVYMAAERYTGSFFGNGATLAGVVMFDRKFPTPEARGLYRKSFNETFVGSGKDNKWFIADDGAKVQTLESNPQKSQLIETLKFRIEDAARWFRVPPTIIGHNTATPFTNVEALHRQYFMTGLKPWALRIEKEYTRKLVPSDDPALFVEHVVEALLWADVKTRTEVANMRIRGGYASPNEIRAILNQNPIPGGDLYRVEQNLAVIGADGRPEPVNTPTPPPAPGAAPDSMALKAMAMPVFVDAAERVINYETNALGGKRKVTFAWLDEFYTKHHAYVISAVTPALTSLGNLVGSDVTGMAERYADAHCGESRRRLDAGEDPNGWHVDRPAWIAQHLTDEVCK